LLNKPEKAWNLYIRREKIRAVLKN